ncbi:thiamine pyrophosphate-binding protein [Cerasicoccus maritimus]|uniref:thiamine pyrophosphate-binding protein n=1 Tax=Cerasicoccus maritimus TaxID=490089 RepID=UPI0028528859|nr:thiamine pyrophosphate-binding protein [Cerasicoccus maritimus]
MKISVSQYIVDYLKLRGVSKVFELSGGMIMHLIDSLEQAADIDVVNVYHEQSGAFAADAVGRLTGKAGVALGTSGPGAINLLTGVGSSFFDSSPTVFITGQVNRHEQKGEQPIRQLGFQETDIVAMVKPITKWALKLTEPEQILGALPKAFDVAESGRPGSVLLDIPMDIFRAEIEVPSLEFPEDTSSSQQPSTEDIYELLNALRSAKKPLILAGAGIRAAGAATEFCQFVEQSEIPVVTSLLGLDILPASHPLRVGMIGTYGNRWANLAIANSDLLLVLGSRLDIRQTGAITEFFTENRKVIHVDIEAAEMNNRVKGCQAIHADLKAFFKAIGDQAPSLAGKTQPWLQEINDLRQKWPHTEELQNVNGINPNDFIHQLSNGRQAAAYCIDVGLHQMWSAQSLQLPENCRFLTSGGMGSMGFALPAALGSAFTYGNQQPIVMIAGDGGFQVNIQELQSVQHHQLPIKMIVLNNHCHGMTRQFQDTYFGARYAGTYWGYSTPDFSKVAAAYAIESKRISQVSETKSAIDWLWEDPLKPQLLEVDIDMKVNSYPKIAFGKPISEMEPHASPVQMGETR